MTKRSPIAVALLPFITFGLYGWYWLVKSKGELNAANRDNPHVPTCWIWLIPFIGFIWWYWNYAAGVEKHTKGKCSQVIAFILLFLLGSIGYAIIQDFFNKANNSKS